MDVCYDKVVLVGFKSQVVRRARRIVHKKNRSSIPSPRGHSTTFYDDDAYYFRWQGYVMSVSR